MCQSLKDENCLPKLHSIFEPQSANEKLAPRKRTQKSVIQEISQLQ